VIRKVITFQLKTNLIWTSRSSCSLQVAQTVVEVSHATAAMHNLQTLFQGQALQLLERQDTSLQQVLHRLAKLHTRKKDAVGDRRHSSLANVTHYSSCIGCTFLRNNVQALWKSSCPRLTRKQGMNNCMSCMCENLEGHEPQEAAYISRRSI
jgi:hypothetical protein